MSPTLACTVGQFLCTCVHPACCIRDFVLTGAHGPLWGSWAPVLNIQHLPCVILMCAFIVMGNQQEGMNQELQTEDTITARILAMRQCSYPKIPEARLQWEREVKRQWKAPMRE